MLYEFLEVFDVFGFKPFNGEHVLQVNNQGRLSLYKGLQYWMDNKLAALLREVTVNKVVRTGVVNDGHLFQLL